MSVLDDRQPFTEPWQAQVFALAIHLHEQGVFTWSEWAQALSAEVRRPEAAPDGSDYYEHWTAALQAILAAKGVAAGDAIDRVAAAWERAAEATPHGMPIELANDPEREATGSRAPRVAGSPGRWLTDHPGG